MDGTVREIVQAQLVNVRIVYLSWGEGEFFGVGTEGAIRGCKRGRFPILCNVMYQPIRRGRICQTKIAFNLSTEVVGVGPRSVNAVVE